MQEEQHNGHTSSEKPSSNGVLQRVIGNAASLLTSQVLNRATTFVLYMMVARYLGVEDFGKMSLGLLLMYTFQIFAAAGLKILITREVTRFPEKEQRYLINGTLAVLMFSLLSFLILAVFVFFVGYKQDTALVVLLLGAALVPYALSSICEALFQAKEQMHLIAFANVPSNILKVVGAWFLLEQGHGILMVSVLITLCHSIVLVVEWWLVIRHSRSLRFEFDVPFTRSMLKQTLPFLGLESVIAIWASVGTVLISTFSNEFALGLYNASAQLMVPAVLVVENLALSIFPMMCRKFDMGAENLKTIYEHLIEALLAVALPAAVGLTFLCEPILLLLYGNERFAQGADVMRVLVWILVPMAFTHALGQVLLASKQEMLTLKIVIVNTIISVIIGVIFIIPLGAIGAALSSVISQFVDFLQHYVPVSKIVRGLSLWRVSWKPAAASLVMAVYLFFVSHMLIWFVIPTAALVYGVSLFALLIISSGGLAQLKARYFMT
jgi:O-antigen/teichoic acid export membrane protein